VLRIAVAMMTGGSGKTTTTGNLALALAARYGDPRKVLVVDTDKQGQIVSWEQTAHQRGGTWPLTLSWLNSKLAVELDRQVDMRPELEAIVVDTSNNDFRLVVDSLTAVDVALTPVQPTEMDLDRIAATEEAVDLAQGKNPGLRWGLFMSRYDARSRDAEKATDALREAGYHVLEESVPARARIGRSFGKDECADLDRYTALLDEALRGW
jgi:cellulose biosynthesis protein BcsQ